MSIVNIEHMTNGEKLQLYIELVRKLCGVEVPLSESKGQWIVPLTCERIEPGCTQTVVAPLHDKLKVRRLFIFEPEIVLPYTEATQVCVETKSWWWGKTKKVYESRPPVRETLKRNGWAIHTILVGQHLQLPACGTLLGDAFGGDPQFDLDGRWAQPGLSVSVVVENRRGVAAPFFACLLCEGMEQSDGEEKSAA